MPPLFPHMLALGGAIDRASPRRRERRRESHRFERFVVDQIKCIGRDPALVAETVSQAQMHVEAALKELRAERTALQVQLRRDVAETRRLGEQGGLRGADVTRLADATDRIRHAERRTTEIDQELASLEGDLIDESEVAAALADFDALWDSLAPREQIRVVELLVERVTYDAARSSVSITFHPAGIKALASQLQEVAQ